MSYKQLLADEAELDKLYNVEAPVETPVDGTIDLTADKFTTEQPVTVAVPAKEPTGAIVDDVTDEPEKPKRTSWKQRYASYKASTDTTIFELRQGNAKLHSDLQSLSATVELLKGQLAEGQPNAVDSVITQEDEDTIGPDAVAIMKKTTEAATKDLKAELAALKEEQKQEAKDRAANARRQADLSFRDRLVDLVEGDLSEIDSDPKFSKYLQAVDPVTGVPRKRYFDSAVSSGDIVRTAGFFNDYTKTLAPSKDSILAKEVTPIGTGATPSPEGSKPQTYTIAEYNAVYDALNKRSYQSTKEKNELIKQADLLDQAYVEGRII